MSKSRWVCPHCGSENVQISLPTWYKEDTAYQLTFVNTDSEAHVLWWYCEDCEETDSGFPKEQTK